MEAEKMDWLEITSRLGWNPDGNTVTIPNLGTLSMMHKDVNSMLKLGRETEGDDLSVGNIVLEHIGKNIQIGFRKRDAVFLSHCPTCNSYVITHTCCGNIFNSCRGTHDEVNIQSMNMVRGILSPHIEVKRTI